MTDVYALYGNDRNIVQFHECDNVLRSGDLCRDEYENPTQIGGEYIGDLSLLKLLIREYRPIRLEAADAELAPMPLSMPCLVPFPQHDGVFVARHEHRGQKREGCEGGLGIHTYGQMNRGSNDSGFHERWRVLECLSRALAYTPRASGENAANAKRGRHAPWEHIIGRIGSPDGGRARGGQGARTVEEPGEARSFDENGRLFLIREVPME
ncbi:hypothetical protein KY285_036405 [Solanum tuberosum]|nr:hypothetical protein KY285_036405 [Solanum tuberosum]